MEELLDKLETANIKSNVNDETKSEFQGLYKNWGRLDGQELRRKEILEIQKSNRNYKLDHVRGILELVNIVEDTNIFKTSYVEYRPTIYVAGFNKASHTYSNVLMMSEWMIEKPNDFLENWLITPCPKGIRMLVVATKGITKCYTKFGQLRLECRTALPGGNPCDNRSRTCTVLDCFYVEMIKTMFVLDLLAWKNQPMTDGETEFRQFWMESQFSEIPELKVINKKNKLKFLLLPKTPCTVESLNKFMMTYPQFENNLPSLDGLLFYHKRAHYFAGETPLVGWLFPYMVPELLGTEITIHDQYKLLKPVEYTNQMEFIKKFEAKLEKKKNRKRHSASSSAMDVADVDNVNENQEVKKDEGPSTQEEEAKSMNTASHATDMDSECPPLSNPESNPNDMDSQTVSPKTDLQ